MNRYRIFWSTGFTITGVVLALLCLASCATNSVEPKHKSEADDKFTFCVYGDTRTGHDAHRKVVDRLVALEPDFVIHTGDMVAKGRDEEQWKTFFEISKPLLDVTPFYPTRGNHDGKLEPYSKRFSLPSGTSGGKLYYTFNKGKCHFIVLDTAQDYSRGSVMHNWFRQDLAANRLPIVFVFMHTPLYPARIRSGKVSPDNVGLIDAFQNLFEQFKVTAVWSGHVHLYHRTERGGVPFICAAGGGAPLYDIAQEKMRPGDVALKEHHVVTVEVDGTQIQCRTYLIDGTVADEFRLD
ncbi:metallophosphoesterase family protein [Candidatus Hydrogenedentota bacterium]